MRANHMKASELDRLPGRFVWVRYRTNRSIYRVESVIVRSHTNPLICVRKLFNHDGTVSHPRTIHHYDACFIEPLTDDEMKLIGCF